ncbi:MAG: hypothetical protein AAF456_03760 [Planctomycetota bacterium]
MRSICNSKTRLLNGMVLILSFCVLTGCRSGGDFSVPKLTDLAWWNPKDGAIARNDAPAPPALHFSPDSNGLDGSDTEQLRENLNQILATNDGSGQSQGAPIRQPYSSGGEMDSQFFELEEPSNFDPLTGRLKTDLPGSEGQLDSDDISPEALADALEQRSPSMGGSMARSGAGSNPEQDEWRDFDLPKPEFGGSFDNALSAARDTLNRDARQAERQFGQAEQQFGQAEQQFGQQVEQVTQQAGRFGQQVNQVQQQAEQVSGGAFQAGGGQFAANMSEETREIANQFAGTLGRVVENTAEQIQSTNQSGGAFGQRVANEFMGAGEQVADTAREVANRADDGFRNLTGSVANSADSIQQQRMNEMQQTIDSLQEQLASQNTGQSFSPQRLESVGPADAFPAENPVAGPDGGIAQSSFGDDGSSSSLTQPTTNYESTGAPEFPSVAQNQSLSSPGGDGPVFGSNQPFGQSMERPVQPNSPTTPRNILRNRTATESRVVYPETGAGSFASAQGDATAESNALTMPAPNFGGAHYAPGTVRTELPPRR